MSAVSLAIDARYLKRPDVGISRYIVGLLERLGDDGLRPTLLTDDAAHARRLAADHGLTAVALPCRSGMAWEQMRLAGWLRRNRPDAVLAPANYGLPLAPVAGTRRVAVVHDLIPLRMPRPYLRDPAWFAKYLASVAVTLAVADLVLTPSEATARDVRRVTRARVEVLPPSLPQVAAAGEGPPEDWPERYVIYNGGRDPRKNVPRLLAAFARYRALGGDHDLVLMGPGYEAHRPEIGRLGVSGCVLMPGFVAEEAKAGALRGAGAVLYPSSWEGFGLPLVEAFAAGVPVVCGRGGAQEEIGGDAALYVDVGDIGSIADGIARATGAGRRATARVEGPRRLAALAGAAGDTAVGELLLGGRR